MEAAKPKRHLTLIEQLETMAIVLLILAILGLAARWYGMIGIASLIGLPIYLGAFYLARREPGFPRVARVLITLLYLGLAYVAYQNS